MTINAKYNTFELELQHHTLKIFMRNLLKSATTKDLIYFCFDYVLTSSTLCPRKNAFMLTLYA